MSDDQKLESDELINQLYAIHPCFMENCAIACHVFQKLLDAIDHHTQWSDYDIERKYGKRVLKAFLEADKAIQNIEYYFKDETE